MASEDINNQRQDSGGREGIKYPGKHDVMLGRGGEANNHSGNLIFRQFAEIFKGRYQATARQKKPEVAIEVVWAWRRLSPPGRFLARTHPDIADSLWHEVSDDLSRKRVSKTLGERACASRQRKRAARSKATTGRTLSDTRATRQKITASISSTDGRSSVGNSSRHDAPCTTGQDVLLEESQRTMVMIWGAQYPQQPQQLQPQQQYHTNIPIGDYPAEFPAYALAGADTQHRSAAAAQSYASSPAHMPPRDLESINHALNQLPCAASLARTVFSDDDEIDEKTGKSSRAEN